MNAKGKLAAWLSGGKDYQEGVSIFIGLNINKTMNQFFTTANPDKVRINMLGQWLERYARVHNIRPAIAMQKITPKPAIVQAQPGKVVKPALPVKAQETTAVIQRPRIDKNPHVQYDKLPPHLQVLFDENGKLNNELRTYHAELKAIADDASKQGRREYLAKSAVAHGDQIRENWDTIDAWWAENQKPADPIEQAKKEAIETENRIKANLNYIRRFYGKEKQKNEVGKRMQELDKMGVDYQKLIGK